MTRAVIKNITTKGRIQLAKPKAIPAKNIQPILFCFTTVQRPHIDKNKKGASVPAGITIHHVEYNKEYVMTEI